MALRYAVLAALLDGEMTGYDLARVFDISVANFWHALPQQIYAELIRLEEAGLVAGRTVIQESRPNKRLFKLTTEGRDALAAWIAAPARAASLKDDLLVRSFAADAGDLGALATAVSKRRGQAEEKLARYRAIEAVYLRGRTEAELLTTTSRIGPYLTLRRGIRFEQDNIAWCDWAVEALRMRAAAMAAKAEN